jgi:hypothetical protein
MIDSQRRLTAFTSLDVKAVRDLALAPFSWELSAL